MDTATHLVCASVGLRVDGESVPYVAGWGEDGAIEAVAEFAKDDRRARPADRERPAGDVGNERAAAAWRSLAPACATLFAVGERELVLELCVLGPQARVLVEQHPVALAQ